MANIEWIDVNCPIKELDLKAGMLLEFASGLTELVGGINEVCGACDCCRGYPKDTIVVRYAIIWTQK